MSFLAPLFFVGLAAIAVPILVHLIQRERKDVVEFPSLMFIRRFRTSRSSGGGSTTGRCCCCGSRRWRSSSPRSRGRSSSVDPLEAAAATSGAREVVILLDRSASMGYGDHWARAQDEARRIVNGLGGEDRATLVLSTPASRKPCARPRAGASSRRPSAGAAVSSERARATRRRCGWRRAC